MGCKSFTSKMVEGSIHVGNIQHIGNRSKQQDAFGFSEPSGPTGTMDQGIFAVVADGMGGLKKGAAASNVAVQTMLSAYRSWNGNLEPSSWVLKAVNRTNQVVLNFAESSGLKGQVGATLSSLLVHRDNAHWVSVGDSRIYLNRNDDLSKLTKDHVFARELEKRVRKGTMQAEAARQHPDRGALTSYLGVSQLNQIAQNDRPLSLEDGDQFLICSDGLYDNVNREQMRAALELPPQKACKALLQQVIGSADEHQDNVTAMVLEYERDDPPEKN